MNSLCNRIDDHHISFAAIDIKEEASVATLLMNMENEFDPFDALSTPLYQTATFKQVVELNQRLCCHFMVMFLSLLFFFCSLLLLKMVLMTTQEVGILHGMRCKGICFLSFLSRLVCMCVCFGGEHFS